MMLQLQCHCLHITDFDHLALLCSVTGLLTLSVGTGATPPDPDVPSSYYWRGTHASQGEALTIYKQVLSNPAILIT
jgi:hypothetical protein